MRALLDVNVLVALFDAEHINHVTASEWLDTNLANGWASCPLTENGCLRVMTNPHYGAPKLPRQVLAKLEQAKNGRHHEFWPDSLSMTNAAIFDRNKLRGHQQVTDIYLLALAVEHGGRLATFDQRIQCEAVPGSNAEHLVIL